MGCTGRHVTIAAREEKSFFPVLYRNRENSKWDAFVKEAEGMPKLPPACLHPL